MASGYVKVAVPLARYGKGTYGKQDDTLVSAITPAGKRALTPLTPPPETHTGKD